MRQFLKISMLSAAVAGSAVASAEPANWYLNTGFGIQISDDRFVVEDDFPIVTLGLEHRFNQKWGVEIWGARGEVDDESLAGGEADFSSVSTGLVRYLGDGGNLEPYFAAGVGAAGYEFDNRTGSAENDFYTQLNAGLGLRWMFSNSIGLRSELRYLYGADDSTEEAFLSIGLSVPFGGAIKSEEPAPAMPVDGDMDGDGVKDSFDKCAGTPAGVAVDAQGCPLDGDQDGVPNYRDKCPNTPAGRQVDKFGCKFVLTSTETIKLEVQFALNSAAVPAAYQSEIAKVAAFLKKYGNVNAVVEGHTDSTGEAPYNKQLSQRRADAVRMSLVKDHGIAETRLRAVGYGEERPVASNATREGRKANRRVVAVVEAEVTK